ncbi:MAG: GNAT family N-acetyltransferase [Cellulosilyticaceae bacterium]
MVIKQLEKDNLVQREAFIRLVGYSFRGCGPAPFEADWENYTPDVGMIMGNWDGDTLASAIMISHRQIMIDGKAVAMDGLGGVATSPVYRNGGWCSALIKEGLKQMYEHGAVFSALAPFSYAFYEKLGWKWSYNHLIYNVPMSELAGFKSNYKVELVDASNMEELKVFYEEHIQSINGVGLREDWNWQARLQTAPYGIIVRDLEQHVVGYMLYEIYQGQDLFKVCEIQNEDVQALKTMFSYIYGHCGQVGNVEFMTPEYIDLLDYWSNPRWGCHKNTGMMLRVVNVQEALKAYNYEGKGSFSIKVMDEVCEWNNKTFSVQVAQNLINIEETVTKPDLTINIRQLAQVLIGFRTLDEVEHEGTLKGYFKEKRGRVVLMDSF